MAASIPLSNPVPTVIRVLVADADRLNCELLTAALERTADFQVKGAVNSAEVLNALTQSEPDVAVVSLSFLGDRERVFKLLRELKEAYPQIRVVVLMDSVEKQTVVESFRAGAKGVFSRSESFPNLCKCIQRVWEGQIWATSTEMEYALQALTETRPIRVDQPSDSVPLSKREEQVVRLVADGLSNRDISLRLKLSEHTIKNYLSRIFEKLGVSTRVELVLYALSYRAHLSEPSEPTAGAGHVAVDGLTENEGDIFR